ncbi:MAG: Tex-like protein N-terminal domain, partial [Paenibacillaceae bacterium]|nr:Tex-like protein N-terminal domain [Paenibacillaceae bacterium]
MNSTTPTKSASPATLQEESKPYDLTPEQQKAIEHRIIRQISTELQLPEGKVHTTAGLLDEGNTIPF